jgi:hypothetical protein
VRSPDLQIAGRYFRAVDERHPFAWDIVGPREKLAGIAATFSRRGEAAAGAQPAR